MVYALHTYPKVHTHYNLISLHLVHIYIHTCLHSNKHVLLGGAVDPGESLTGAAVRETMEEAGVHVTLKGVLGIEYHPMGQASSKCQHYICTYMYTYILYVRMYTIICIYAHVKFYQQIY
jgi:hypothetical protein